MDERRHVLGEPGSYEDQPVPKEGRPILATVVASVLLLGAAATPAPPGYVPEDPGAAIAFRIFEILGGGLIVALLFWGVAYAITIRHASRGWKVASFLILLLVAILVMAVRVGNRQAAMREDAAFVAKQLEGAVSRGETPTAPVSAGDGPLGAMIAAFMNRNIEQAQAFQRESVAAGTEQLLNLTLDRSSPTLRNCGRFDALAAVARANAGKFDSHVAAARAAGDPFIARGALAEGDRAAFFQGLEASRGDYMRQWRLTGDWIAEIGGLCRLLAERPWQRDGGSVAFSAQRDSDAANRRIERINVLAAEVEQIQRSGQEQARRGMDALGGAPASTRR